MKVVVDVGLPTSSPTGSTSPPKKTVAICISSHAPLSPDSYASASTCWRSPMSASASAVDNVNLGTADQ